MTNLLFIQASARGQRSLSRGLAEHFAEAWSTREPDACIVWRDVGRNPPPFVSEQWIAAAFTPESERLPEQKEALNPSDELIAELKAADIIVIASPIYNYGMPAALKAWFDQVIRINETFSFDLSRGDWPLEPTMRGKRLVVLSSRGEFGFEPGGIRAHMNHLDTHIATCAHYLGAERPHFVSIDYQEFGDHRHQASIEAAYKEVIDLVDAVI